MNAPTDFSTEQWLPEQSPINMQSRSGKPMPTLQEMEQFFNNLPAAPEGTATTSIDALPDELKKKISDRYNKLVKKYPHMKRHRLLRKVGEELKIKFFIE